MPVLMLAYFFMGIVQFFAIWDGVERWLGVGEFYGFLLALGTAYIPLVGSVFGFFAATDIWGWDWWWAALLFFWQVPFYLIDIFSDR